MNTIVIWYIMWPYIKIIIDVILFVPYSTPCNVNICTIDKSVIFPKLFSFTKSSTIHKIKFDLSIDTVPAVYTRQSGRLIFYPFNLFFSTNFCSFSMRTVTKGSPKVKLEVYLKFFVGAPFSGSFWRQCTKLVFMR